MALFDVSKERVLTPPFLEEDISFRQKWMSDKKYYKCENFVVSGVLWRHNKKWDICFLKTQNFLKIIYKKIVWCHYFFINNKNEKIA